MVQLYNDTNLSTTEILENKMGVGSIWLDLEWSGQEKLIQGKAQLALKNWRICLETKGKTA